MHNHNPYCIGSLIYAGMGLNGDSGGRARVGAWAGLHSLRGGAGVGAWAGLHSLLSRIRPRPRLRLRLRRGSGWISSSSYDRLSILYMYRAPAVLCHNIISISLSLRFRLRLKLRLRLRARRRDTEGKGDA